MLMGVDDLPFKVAETRGIAESFSERVAVNLQFSDLLNSNEMIQLNRET